MEEEAVVRFTFHVLELEDFPWILLGLVWLRYQRADRVLISSWLIGLQHSRDDWEYLSFCRERHFDAYPATLVAAK